MDRQSLYPRYAFVSLLALALVLAACRKHGGEDFVNELVIGLENAPIHLDPRLATDQASGRIFEVMLNGLIGKDSDGNFIPDLASSWEVLDDATRYRFHLRPGIRFHDGRELTADDVVWTFGTMLDGTVITPKRGGFPQLQRVEAADDHTVDFHLSEPYGALLINLTCFLGIVPHGSQPEQFNRSPIGTGPFRLVEKLPDKVTLEAFDDYWEGRPKLDRLIFREIPDATVRALELKKGSIHFLVNALPPDLVADFRKDEDFTVLENPGSNYSYIGLNLENPILRNPKVRRAIALSLDRRRLIATLWQGLGVPTETLLRPGHWARNDDLPTIAYDPARAKELLDAAGFQDPDGDGPLPRLTLVYKTSTDETTLLQAQIIQSMLAEVGVEIEIRSYEFATFYSDIKRGNFQMFSLTWTGIVDPDIYSMILHSERIPPAGDNRGRYRNPDFDRLIDQGARYADPRDRRPYYLQAQEILAQDLPYISLFIKANVAVMPRSLRGYRNYPSGELHALKQAYWQTTD